MSLSDLPREYTAAGLREQDCDPSPIRQFSIWFQEALAANLPDTNAMTLATCPPNGRPSARIVLLKGCDDRGFTFFTNYLSRKGQEIAANPFASLVLFWPEIERQIRIEGKVEKVTAKESDEYHRTRPRGSQLGAWCSEQSEVVAGRDVLEARLRDLERRFGDGEVPRPPHWGGYRLEPDMIEFWQGRPNRLHDRIRYRLVNGAWIMERLSP
jgi:pyridoxamine 5'-phosphate oxidase